jgi:hypothetical protein
VSIVTLDQITVVAVHRPDECADLIAHDRVKLAGKAVGFGNEVDGKIREIAPAGSSFGREHGLHAAHRFAVVAHTTFIHVAESAGSSAG